ncbi:LicD family-domain-containing protein [Daldinia loculata]|uniref:LicD family-domain-containing protein n=1 Tax=Daldinia loculata TaxID=103429 RepID=UPI0020C2D1EC|nr:LicD family-domain-containing protein [Daldinia loculata]KAI1642193.1 LicD family-domain-containing protein [Daldinia loculata]
MHFTLPILLFSLTASTVALPDKLPSHHKSNTAHKKPPPSKSKPDSQHQPKYFHEAGATLELGHYDARFFRGVVPYAEHGPALQRLIRSWLTTTRELGVDTWLAHGTLLGWWWNGRVMPWDYDLDVQMPTATLSYLGRHFNRTLHDYQFIVEGDGRGGETIIAAGGSVDAGDGRGNREDSDRGEDIVYINKTYLLDVNPHHADLTRGNGANIIDARWIDTGTGLFVDITGLAERDAVGSPGVWSCKNAHRYRTREIYPVRRTEFEGVPARVPYAFDKILTDEYGEKSLVNTEWAGHRWVPELKEWVKNPEPPPGDKGNGNGKEGKTVTKQQQDGKAVVVVVEKTVVKGAQ